MGRDPISERFEKRKSRKKLDDLGEKTRSKDDLDAERKLLKETEKVKPIRSDTTTGRNDPCPCGSGKKFKKCCGKGK